MKLPKCKYINRNFRFCAERRMYLEKEMSRNYKYTIQTHSTTELFCYDPWNVKHNN